jgi:hypothetical protein
MLALFPIEACKQEAKKIPEVTLAITRVRGFEYSVIELEGEMKGKDVRYVLLSCEVVIDNQTDEELTVMSNFFSAFDGLHVLLLRNGKIEADEAYIWHQSPRAEAMPYVLKKGKNQRDLRIPFRLPPDDWASLQAKAVGELPGSCFKGKLESNTTEIQRVGSFER